MIYMDNENARCWADCWRQAGQSARNGGPRQASFWDRRAPKYGGTASGRGDEKKLEELLELSGIESSAMDGARVLDIGAGPGTLAIPLARLGAKVTAVDISKEMLKKLEKRAAEENLTSVRTILSPWKDIDLDAAGFRGQFDLVIASMTPGIDGPEAFDKMMAASKGVCYYSGWVSRTWDNAYYELYRKLFNEEFRESWAGFPFPLVYLYTMGYRPVVRLIRDTWKSDEDVAGMVDTLSGFFSANRDIDEDAKGRMRTYFEGRAEGGVYHAETNVIVGMMAWKARRPAPVDS
jgi:SAM-dependent methyltransferase